MKKSTLLLIWGILYIICAGLGFIPEPQGMVRAMLFLVSLLFFLPPAVLLYRGKTQAWGAGLRRQSAAPAGHKRKTA